MKVNSYKGVTLIELITVLFIVSLVAAIIFPSFEIFGGNKLKSEAREIGSILKYLNESASSSKETFSIVFNLDEHTVIWNDREGLRERKFEDISGVETQSNGMVTKGELTLFFPPTGIQQNIIVHLNRDDKKIMVSLNHLNSKIKIYD